MEIIQKRREIHSETSKDQEYSEFVPALLLLELSHVTKDIGIVRSFS